jgi:hypothetical protein
MLEDGSKDARWFLRSPSVSSVLESVALGTDYTISSVVPAPAFSFSQSAGSTFAFFPGFPDASTNLFSKAAFWSQNFCSEGLAYFWLHWDRVVVDRVCSRGVIVILNTGFQNHIPALLKSANLFNVIRRTKMPLHMEIVLSYRFRLFLLQVFFTLEMPFPQLLLYTLGSRDRVL